MCSWLSWCYKVGNADEIHFLTYYFKNSCLAFHHGVQIRRKTAEQEAVFEVTKNAILRLKMKEFLLLTSNLIFLQNYHQQGYVWKCALLNITTFLLLGLEVSKVVPHSLPSSFHCHFLPVTKQPSLCHLLQLGEFPPIFWILDAHALWHLGTAPMCYFWYRLV